LKKHLKNGILKLTKSSIATTKESAFSKLIPLYHCFMKNSRKSSLFFGIYKKQKGDRYVIKNIRAKEPVYNIAGIVGRKSRKQPTCGAVLSVLGRNTEFESIQEYGIRVATV